MNLIQRQFAGFVLLNLLMAMTIGGFLSADMMMKDGIMQPCPFMDNTASICNMSPLEHVAQWQQMFTTTVQNSLSITLLALLSALVLLAFIGILPVPKRPPIRLSFSRYRYRERIFDPMRILFSRGILNPKLY